MSVQVSDRRKTIICMHALLIMDESLSWWGQKVVCCFNWLWSTWFSGPFELEMANMKHPECSPNCRLFKMIALNCGTFMLTWTLRGYIYLLSVYSKRGLNIAELLEYHIVFFPLRCVYDSFRTVLIDSGELKCMRLDALSGGWTLISNILTRSVSYEKSFPGFGSNIQQ